MWGGELQYEESIAGIRSLLLPCGLQRFAVRLGVSTFPSEPPHSLALIKLLKGCDVGLSVVREPGTLWSTSWSRVACVLWKAGMAPREKSRGSDWKEWTQMQSVSRTIANVKQMVPDLCSFPKHFSLSSKGLIWVFLETQDPRSFHLGLSPPKGPFQVDRVPFFPSTPPPWFHTIPLVRIGHVASPKCKGCWEI